MRSRCQTAGDGARPGNTVWAHCVIGDLDWAGLRRWYSPRLEGPSRLQMVFVVMNSRQLAIPDSQLRVRNTNTMHFRRVFSLGRSHGPTSGPRFAPIACRESSSAAVFGLAASTHDF